MKYKTDGNKMTIYSSDTKGLAGTIKKNGGVVIAGKAFKLVGGIIIMKSLIEFLFKALG